MFLGLRRATPFFRELGASPRALAGPFRRCPGQGNNSGKPMAGSISAGAIGSEGRRVSAMMRPPFLSRDSAGRAVASAAGPR